MIYGQYRFAHINIGILEKNMRFLKEIERIK